MTTFVTIIFIIVALMMILSILLQAGKGGGLGTALGGGASQGVFGSGGGADFMSKLTQGFAATFMISAMYLAYASAHAGSDFLEKSDEGAEDMLGDDEEINYERLGPRAQELPSPEEGKAMQAKAAALVPPLTEAPADLAGGISPDANPVEGGDSPQGGEPILLDSVPDGESVREPAGESD
jgi:preprotein translocase subunit SecG